MKRALLLGVLLVVGGLSLVVSGQAPGPSAKAIAATKIEKVKDNLYIITGSGVEDTTAFSGGNVAVFITDGSNLYLSSAQIILNLPVPLGVHALRLPVRATLTFLHNLLAWFIVALPEANMPRLRIRTIGIAWLPSTLTKP